jgi:hypothetical protein
MSLTFIFVPDTTWAGLKGGNGMKFYSFLLSAICAFSLPLQFSHACAGLLNPRNEGPLRNLESDLIILNAPNQVAHMIEVYTLHSDELTAEDLLHLFNRIHLVDLTEVELRGPNRIDLRYRLASQKYAARRLLADDIRLRGTVRVEVTRYDHVQNSLRQAKVIVPTLRAIFEYLKLAHLMKPLSSQEAGAILILLENYSFKGFPDERDPDILPYMVAISDFLDPLVADGE